MSVLRSVTVLLATTTVLTACSNREPVATGDPEGNASGTSTASQSGPPSASPSLDASSPRLRALAEQYLDALVSDASCDEVWAMVVSDGDDKSGFCGDLSDYRKEVSRLALGGRTDLAEDYAVFRVRVDYRDGSPSVLDSEVEVDVVDGQPYVFDGLP